MDMTHHDRSAEALPVCSESALVMLSLLILSVRPTKLASLCVAEAK